jgi:diphthamide synthase (EF-2-diphthine--ammonia ligase)
VLCVVPASNKDDLEVQFVESERSDKHQDTLVQMTFHFPTEEEEEEEVSKAESFQKEVMDTGIIRSMTGDIIAEFTKEQGNFVTPRGKYAIQVPLLYRQYLSDISWLMLRMSVALSFSR